MTPQLVALFPGQGSQWPGMAAPLLAASPAFHSTITAVDAIVEPRLGWSVAGELQAADEASRLEEILVLQVALFAVEVGLAATWAERGIRPHAVAGTSLGEIAAAHVAGILTLADALHIVITRSELLEVQRPAGGTVVVNVDAADAPQLLAGLPAPAFVAGFNGPGTTTFSGHEAALVELLRRGEERGVFAARVRIDYPAHSPLLAEVGAQLHQRLSDITPHDSTIPFYSAVTGIALPGASLDAAYWAQNLMAPVLGRQMLDRLLADDYGVILEVTPHPIFAKPTDDAIAARGANAIHCPTLRRRHDPFECLAAATARLHSAGVRPAE